MQYLFGDCLLDTDRFEMRRAGGAEPLEPQVFDLLLYLVENRDRIISKHELLEQIWDGRAVSESALTSRIKTARRAIGDSGESQRLIRTYRNRGFRFIGDVEERQDNVNSELPSGSEPGIAVLPFSDLSAGGGEEYFSDGISAEIISLLARNRGLKVMARGSSFAFRDDKASFAEIGGRLGVNYIVEGTVQRSGEQVRVTAGLVRVDNGQQIWGDRYDRRISDLFDVQDEVSHSIASAIIPELGRFAREQALRKPPDSLSAWECVQRGEWHLFKFVIDEISVAEQWFARAVSLDPEFARAQAGLAHSYIQQTFYGRPADRNLNIRAAEAAARRGVQLDERDAYCHYVLARALALARETEEAVSEGQLAIRLEPGNAHCYFALGWAQVAGGMERAGIENLERAVSLSPFDPYQSTMFHMQALGYYQLGELDEAEERARQAIRKGNATYWPFATLCSLLGSQGKLVEAATVRAQLMQRKPDYTCAYAEADFYFTKGVDFVERYVGGLRKAGVPGPG